MQKNLTSLLEKMSTAQTTQLWTMSSDGLEYERYKNLLSGRLINSLSPEGIDAQTLCRGLENVAFKNRIEIIHDGCDIRKQYSKKLPNLAKVRDLDGDIVNGYNSFNSLFISDIDKSIHLLSHTSYSTADPHYNAIAGVSFDHDSIVLNQITATDQALKTRFKDLPVRHLLDRGHDDQTVFEHINQLKSSFVIRLKASRNSNEIGLNKKGKLGPIKLIDAQLDHTHQQLLEKFIWKNKCFEQAKLNITQGTLQLDDNTYTVLRIEVFDRKGKNIFKDPMLLITNELSSNLSEAFAIYQAYLRRSKIESVFRFLKDNLGWEDFRVRDFLVIQNVLSLCFFVAGYFYEHQHMLVNDPQVALICKMANSKGKITKHFYLEGLKIIANYSLFNSFVKEQNINQDTVNQLLKHLY